VARNRRLQEKIRDRNTTPESVARIQAITPGESILLIHNPRNPAYRRICDAVMEHGKFDYRLKSSTEIERDDFNGTKAVYVTHWGMIDAIPGEYRGKIIIGVWEGDSWISDGRLSEGATKSFGRAHAVFAANQQFADKLRLLTGKPVHVTTDGVDTMLFKPKVYLRPRGKNLRVGIVGCNWRGDDHKGIEIAREACTAVGATLDVLDAKHGTSQYVPHEEMPLWYNRLDALLICSQEEGGPNPGLEAMACGVSVISTRVGVMPELLGDEWLCDRTADAFAGKLRELSSIGDRRKLGRKSRDRIVSGKWSWENIAYVFEGFLQAELDRVIKTAPIHIPQKEIAKDTSPKEDRIVWEKTPVPKFCWYINDMGTGGAQVAIVRWANAMPEWIRERSVIYVHNWPSGHWPLADMFEREIPGCPPFVHEFPDGATHVLCCWGRPGLEQIKGRVSVLFLADLHAENNLKIYGGANFDRVFAVSDGMTMPMNEVLSSISNESHGLVGPYFPPAIRTAKRWKRDEASSQIVVLYAGRISPDKGADCIPWILKADDRIRIIVHSGVDSGYGAPVRKWQSGATKKIEELAHELGVENRLTIKPFFHGVDLSAMYVDSGADCFLVTSPTEGFCLSMAEALQHGLPCACPSSANAAGLIRDKWSGSLYEYDVDPEKRGMAAAGAIERASFLKSDGAISAISPWVGDRWKQTHGRNLLESVGCCIAPSSDPIVTVAVRWHVTCDKVEWLDACMASVAAQTFRQFTTLMVIDGPHEDAAQIAERYGVTFICTDENPHHHNMSNCHRIGANAAHPSSKYYKPLDFDDLLFPDYLERAVSRMERDGLDLYGCRMVIDRNKVRTHGSWPTAPIWELNKENVFPHCSVLLNKRALLDAGGYAERAPMRGDDDWAVWKRMHANGARMFRDDDYHGCVYRLHADMATKKRTREMAL